MELRRARPHLFWITFFLLGGLLTMWASLNGWELRVLIVPVGSGPLFLFGLVSFLGALALVASTFRPTPIVIDETGLRLHVAGINRSVPWASIDAVLLESPASTAQGAGVPRLVLVPATGVDVGVAAEYTNKVDGRLSIILLGLDSLRASQDEVVRAFERYAEGRFINDPSAPTKAAHDL
ncbi:hypothetical protein ACQPWW_00900 [Micromonospora sp. CA-240977]|uniref:hypothetical protein n=1 Tax=Micromonospora sp. CA-240977 TaxID=3239957 RepID=UPI003D92FFFA